MNAGVNISFSYKSILMVLRWLKNNQHTAFTYSIYYIIY
jgi:hypothetical protein